MSAIKVAIASNSMGKSVAGHTIERKLEAAKAHGFDGVEVAFECVEANATQFNTMATRDDRLRASAADIYEKAQSLDLKLIALNPFRDFDGLRNPRQANARLQEADLWCQLCQIMHIPIIQVPTALYPLEESKVTTDVCVIATNMRKLGRLAEKYDLKIGYEAPSWGIHKSTWQEIQEILARVNLPNVGHCLDTFHIASKEAGDPFNASSPIRGSGFDDLYRSLDELKRTVSPEDIVYLQLSDATTADQEQKGYPNTDLDQPAYMTQSRNCRVFPCEERLGGSLPVMEVAKAVFDMGYTGWVSMEVFHKDMFHEGNSVPDDWARRGMESWKNVALRCGLDRRAKI
ncbi:hypothetical protein N7468_006534 [Penicillium chermesinum]|uniref:Xylose isomerase-like TIM barrel domain-containing protein n=1 Tax=Penicillium chermesinum TaxID=63820 RepID=A0A9W9NV84_9EURO|nr:uncharacterized protein N7468_006534 [Penicillium chermesinum]KAJ5225309.1 hypothetical protein N7468_006534 [Penicillium chermesinum]